MTTDPFHTPPPNLRVLITKGLIDLFNRIAPVVGVAVLGYFGEQGADGGFIKDVWLALKTASPPVAMLLFILYLRSEAERRAAQKETHERTIDFINSTNLAVTTFDKVYSRMQKRRR